MVRQLLHRIRKFGKRKAMILMYHQVCERADDPFELAVHPGNFYDQLDYLQKNFHVIPVSELAAHVAHNTVRDNTLAITFDDGFKDNYSTAAPLLEWFNLPATFYVSTQYVVDKNVYWWEELQAILFHTPILPAFFDMWIGGEHTSFSFQRDAVLHTRVENQIRAWNWNLPVPNERVALFMLLWGRLKPLPYREQRSAMDALRRWAGVERDAIYLAETMSVRELQMLGSSPLFSIGAHSVHHSMLSLQDCALQAFEVHESKRQLEEWLGKSVTGFAYPYGNFNDVTQCLLRQAGYEYAVTTEERLTTREENAFALPRIQVKNWCVYEFGSILNEMVYG